MMTGLLPTGTKYILRADFCWFQMSNRNNNYGYYKWLIMVEYTNLNGYYIERGRIRLDNTEMYMYSCNSYLFR